MLWISGGLMAIIGVKVARVTNLTSWPLGREAAEIAEVLSIEPYALLLIIYQHAMYTEVVMF